MPLTIIYINKADDSSPRAWIDDRPVQTNGCCMKRAIANGLWIFLIDQGCLSRNACATSELHRFNNPPSRYHPPTQRHDQRKSQWQVARFTPTSSSHQAPSHPPRHRQPSPPHPSSSPKPKKTHPPKLPRKHYPQLVVTPHTDE